jgi:selenium metabolism protein YedF
MTKEIDARGLACPQPVVLTKKALEAGEREFVILVDNPTSRDNVRRFAESSGCVVIIAEEGGGYKICISASKEPIIEQVGADVSVRLSKTGTVFYITADSIGRGSEELGRILIPGFFQALVEGEGKPDKIIFTNSGVKLACEGSPILESLKALSKAGVVIVACGTCLDYYNLKDKLQVGSVTNAYEIADSLLTARNVITI